MPKNLYVYAILLLATLTAACAGEATPTPSKTGVASTATPVPREQPAAKPTERAMTQPPKAPVAPYYQGKTIEMIIATGAGGGTDTTARVLAAFLPKHIPGNPKIILRNIPGGETTIGNNTFAEKARPDGLTLITSSFSTVSVTRPDIARYDVKKFEHVGNVTRAGTVLLIRKSAHDRLTDARAKPVIVGAREGTENWAPMPLWGQEFLGWNIKWIVGFANTSELELALRRGEVDMFATAAERQIQSMTNDGLVVTLAQEGMLAGGKVVRRPDFGGTPLFEEVMGAKKPSGLPWLAYLAWVRPALVDKYTAAPPGTPANVMSVLTEAMKAISRDPQFDETAKKVISPIYSVNIGSDTAKMISEVLDMPPEAFKYGTDLLHKYVLSSRK